MKKLFLFIGLLGLNFAFSQETEVEFTTDNSWLKAGLTAGIPVGDAGDAFVPIVIELLAPDVPQLVVHVAV